MYLRSSIIISAPHLSLRVPGSEARFLTWILVEPLISIISMLRRSIASMPALSQRFRRSNDTDEPHESREKAEQAQRLRSNEQRLGDQTAMMHKAGRLASWVCPSPEPPSARPSPRVWKNFSEKIFKPIRGEGKKVLVAR